MKLLKRSRELRRAMENGVSPKPSPKYNIACSSLQHDILISTSPCDNDITWDKSGKWNAFVWETEKPSKP